MVDATAILKNAVVGIAAVDLDAKSDRLQLRIQPVGDGVSNAHYSALWSALHKAEQRTNRSHTMNQQQLINQ